MAGRFSQGGLGRLGFELPLRPLRSTQQTLDTITNGHLHVSACFSYCIQSNMLLLRSRVKCFQHQQFRFESKTHPALQIFTVDSDRGQNHYTHGHIFQGLPQVAQVEE